MDQPDATTTPAAESPDQKATPSSSTNAKATSNARSRPQRPLPTNRIAYPKQLDLLRAYVAASGPTGKAVANKDVAGIVKLSADTISLGNAFFSDVGFLQRLDSGYVPADEVKAFARAHEWQPDSAPERLAPLVEHSWFGETLLTRLQFNAMEEAEAVQVLAEAIGAGPAYRPQINTLIDYMESSGLIVRDGNMIRRVRDRQPNQPERAVAHEQPQASQAAQPAAAHPSRGVSTSFSQAAQGLVAFDVSVRVNMSEMANWTPDRIQAFFAGIAQVLAAKGRIEEESAQED